MTIPRALRLLPLGLALALGAGVLAADETGVVEPAPVESAPGDFTFAAVVRRAAELAANPYAPDRPELPDYLADLDYDKYRDIRFEPEESLWRKDGLPFQMQLFPRGFLYKDRVSVSVIENGRAAPVDFRHDLFNYGKNQVPQEMPADLGYAGLRLIYPINRDELFDEVAVFQGASYFRAVAQGLNYGLSARGLAIDTGLPSQEEFPVFREFWIRKPDPDTTEITVYALLDSDSVAGAYRFLIHPGAETVIDVKSQLFFRKSVEKLGVAPLTSMFFHGENTDRFIDDFRPEVHDSDGLLVETGFGERIWRPLVNPVGLRVSGFEVENPRAFGLFQRDRDFRAYEDLEAHYQNRPSALVEPIGDWGKGVVELIEIPSTAERYDNIGAYWIPERPTEPGQELEFSYRLRFAKDPEAGMLGGRAIATRIGAGGTDILDPNVRKFVVDFAGPTLAALDPESPMEAVVHTTSGELSKPVVQANPENQGWRLFFELKPDGNRPADLRAFLRHGEDVMSETWSFRWVRE
ncbi:glucan biosynthesis protein [Thiocystis violacea]|uniref:glucan biosynthesis protein n=1 Tax=Thiocystis violacea TaxID=13725 RepID=UPI0019058A6D|nr:glucan biosynthesis protein [Thiocystis violacea]MBK1718647.1 glucan biosynthesis protein D [Thiocystis violacea]